MLVPIQLDKLQGIGPGSKITTIVEMGPIEIEIVCQLMNLPEHEVRQELYDYFRASNYLVKIDPKNKEVSKWYTGKYATWRRLKGAKAVLYKNRQFLISRETMVMVESELITY